MTTQNGRARRLNVIEQVQETWTDDLLGIDLEAYEGKNRMSSGRLTWKIPRDVVLGLVSAGRLGVTLEGMTMGMVHTAREAGVAWSDIAACLEIPESTLRRRYQQAADAVELADAVAPGNTGDYVHQGP